MSANATSLGKPLDRRDGRLKVTGTAKFAAEWPVDKVTHAVLVPSTVAKGRIKQLDTTAAEKAPGILAVITHRNAPEMKITKVFDPAEEVPGSAATSVPILNTEEIAWDGQPIAVVVAETLEQARHGAELVTSVFEPGQHRTSFPQGIKEAFAPENVLGEPTQIQIGDAEKALSKAEAKVDRHYTTPAENHNPIEPHAVIAQWEGDRLTVHDASQFVFGIRKMLAEKFSIPEENVRVLSPFVGGGFGCKGLGWPHIALCVAAAKLTNRPVKLSLPRQHYYRIVGGRTPTEQRVALGSGSDGKLTALIHTGITATSTSNMFTEQFTFPARHLYSAPNLLVGQKVTRLDIVPPTFMRAPGETPGTFALESAFDELSYVLGLDPVELRLRNIGPNDPTTKAPYSIRHAREMYELAAEKFGWAKRKPAPRSMREGRMLVGYGVAGAYYPTYQMPSKTRVRIHADGRVVAQSGAHEMGMGTATAQTQNVADIFGVPVERASFELGDTQFPFAAVAGGSSQTISLGGALLAARDALKTKLLEMAGKAVDSPLREARADDLEFRDGGLFLKGDSKRGETFDKLLARAGVESVEAEGAGKLSDAAKKFSIGSYGAVFCEVRVDEEFGTARVTRVTACYDAGRILNSKTAISQFKGGIIMGLGMALMEETLLDSRFGRIMNPNLAEYHLPVHADVPALDIHFLDKPDPHTPMGAHGIGEIGITGVAAAVANAVYHAIGKRIRELPITPDKLMA